MSNRPYQLAHALRGGDGRLLEANPAMELLLGAPTADLRLSPLWDSRVTSESQATVLELERELAAHGRCGPSTVTVERPGREPLVALLMGASRELGASLWHLVPPDEAPLALGAMLEARSHVSLPLEPPSANLDDSERERADDRFRMAVESAPNAMVMVDHQGQIVMVNAQTERLFGFPRAELVGMSIERLVPERFRDRHPEFRRQIGADSKARPMGADRELFGLCRNGSEVPVEIGLNPIKMPEGQFVLASIVDITERRRSQLDLTRKNEELEAFVYIVSHDLRAPLVNLQGFCHELRMSNDDLEAILRAQDLATQPRADIERIRESIATDLHYITASINKFESLILSLVELSRTGRRVFHMESLEVETLLTATLDSLRQSILKTEAQI